MPTRPDRTHPWMWPLYAGGFLGPFGGAMVMPMLPELRDGLQTTLAVAAWSLTAYLIPFASIMIVSGTLAERWGRRRTVQFAYLGYAAASLVCALAPGVEVFLAGRSLQGAANAFTSPLLIAAISEIVPRKRIGRALGHYGSMQAAGQAFAPLIGGAAAALNYRWAFAASAVAALALALVPPPNAAPATSGAGAAGLLGGSLLGRLADRFGIGPFGIAALLVLTGAIVLTGFSGTVAALVMLTAVCGVSSTGGRLVVNTLAVTSTPTNRGGATSMTLAWQFLGSALAPLAFMPVYRSGAELGFWASSAGALFALIVLAAVRLGARRRPAGPVATAPAGGTVAERHLTGTPDDHPT